MLGRKRIAMWLRALAARSRVEAELDEEMRFHLDMEAEKYRLAGLPPDEARRRAVAAFGGVERHKEAMRDGRGGRGLERAARDLRVAFRQLRRTPGFTAAAVITLALGIGGNAVVFGVVNAVLLRPLPYPSADRIVAIGHRSRGGDIPERLPHSSAAYVVYQGPRRTLEAMALYDPGRGSLTGDGSAPEWVETVHATRSLFDVLGVAPALGRTFAAEEDAPGGAAVVVLSHALWRQRFGGDPSVLGRTVVINGNSYTIVGVMPRGFAFPTPDVQLWLPYKLDRKDLGGFNTPGIGRLRAGVTPAAAERELTALLPGITQVVDFIPAQALKDTRLRADVHPYADDVVGSVRPALWTLWAMIGLVLLIACVNVASLLLVRAESRQREVALRVALGAERGHLLAQFLAESVVLLVLGSALGVALARGAVWLLPLLGPGVLPRAGEVGIDGAVLAFTALVAAAAALVFGAIPVARHRNASPASVLSGGGRAATAGRGAGRVRQLLVVSQVAMATVLLVASGLMLRSFQRLRAVDPGFRPEGVLTFRIPLPFSKYREPQAVARFHYAMLDRLRALPGVQAAGATGRLPLMGPTTLIDPLRVEGVPPPVGAGSVPPVVEMRVATPGYFEAMGIPLRAGRLLDRSDTDRQSGAVLVNETVVRTLMQGRDPIGARVAHGLAGLPGARAWSDVVGVVGDVRGASLEEAPVGAVYYAMVNRPGVDMDWLARSMVYAVRTTGASPPAALLPAVRRALGELDPTLPLAEVRTLSQVVDAARAKMRFTMVGLLAAAAVGLFMGAVGLYGVLSYVTAQRTREIGVRIALGASPRSVRMSVLGRGMAVSGAGLAAGLALALALRRLAAPLLYGVSPTDPATLAGVSLVLLAAGALATWLPARRAARLDPVQALRWD